MHNMNHFRSMFNNTVRQLAGQGWKKSVADGLCCYRGASGMMCAFGPHLTDNFAKHLDKKGMTCAELLDESPGFWARTGHSEGELLLGSLMQVAHDSAESSRDMWEKFSLLADLLDNEFESNFPKP